MKGPRNAFRRPFWMTQDNRPRHYGSRTMPAANQLPPALRMRKAMSGSVVQTAGKEPKLPLNSASPWALSAASCVSTRPELPPPALPWVSHTSVPRTCALVPRVPTLLPPASTSPSTSNLKSPSDKSTSARPPVTTQGWPAPVTAPVPEPTTFPVWITPTSASQRTSRAGIAMTVELKIGARMALRTATTFILFMAPPYVGLGTLYLGRIPRGRWEFRLPTAEPLAGLRRLAGKGSAAGAGDAVAAAVELKRLIAQRHNDVNLVAVAAGFAWRRCCDLVNEPLESRSGDHRAAGGRGLVE